jgi:hypothetical protein
MSALSPKADMCGATSDVGYGPIADIVPQRKDIDWVVDRIEKVLGEVIVDIAEPLAAFSNLSQVQLVGVAP